MQRRIYVMRQYVRHGYTYAKIYRVWSHIKQRCYNVKDESFHRYGERGITVCNEWLNNAKAFFDWAMANGYKENLQIDRIDNDKGYSPDNCRFISATDNVRNSTVVKLNIDNVVEIKDLLNRNTMSQTEIAKKYNINQSQISRIKNSKTWK